MDLISIIITTYNRPRWLSQAIESALGQSYKPVEVIVIDDGSDIENISIITDKYTEVKYLYHSHQGTGAARNLGVSVSTGKFIQFLDDDDWLTPDSILLKHEFFLKNPNIDVVYSDLYLCDELGKITKRYYKNQSIPRPRGDIFPQIIKNNFIPIHSLLWRRATLEKSGGFPQQSGHEDWDCLIKASMFARFEFLNKPLGFYRQHPHSMSRNFSVMYSGKIYLQEGLVGSTRFKELGESDQIHLLCKYAFQQWGFGQKNLARDFLAQAHQVNSGAILPGILRIWFKFGQWPTRFAIRLLGLFKNCADRFK